ncbi:hypothetical protein HHK36_013874 [Tetracentron sinense]|uniref:Uncharacterized protein n=1 Tax=Tetracentron sinense TaxID=13715 RepID=A0A834Z731_TETSI|nr:hypothetical protein HHK36_013874 [Tetracentron sinense]
MFPPPLTGVIHEGVVSWGTRNFVVEGTNVEPLDNSSIVLAAKRTYRRDPINGFQRYTGGWNISEQHYWTSVGFTSVPLFLIAAIWFVGFGLCLLLSCLCYCCCPRRKYGYSRMAYATSLIFLMLFTIAAIIGCVVLYTGQGEFHSSTMNTLEYVVKQADTTVVNLKNVSDYLVAAKRIGVAQVSLPSNVQANIDNIKMKIHAAASTLSKQTVKNSKDIQDVLDTV